MQSIWYGDRKPGPLLGALSVLYGAMMRARRAAYRGGLFRVMRVDAPVVVVGNRTVGGSGKTPLVIALVEHLRAQGWNPGVVSRGYGRRSRGQRIVSAQTTSEEGGDEPVLIARRCAIPVVVDADRVAAARCAIARGADIVVADDGLQHLRLHRDLDIEVVDGTRDYGNARVLPAGPLREPLPSDTDATHWLRIVNGSPSEAHVGAGKPEWHYDLIGDTLTGGQGRSRPLQSLRGRTVHAVAGIGNPQRFFATLRDKGLVLREHAFPDHHDYALSDLSFAEALPIVMTEKDWVKCAPFAPADAWALPVRANCPEEFFRAIDRLLPRRSLRND